MCPTSETGQEICYKSNFLTEVIARVDFPVPIESLNKRLPPEIKKHVTKWFPIVEPKDTIAREVHVSATALKSRETPGKQWNFHGRKRTKTLVLNPTCVLMVYRSYESYVTLKEEFTGVLSKFFEVFPETQVSRVGLRYINQIELPGSDPLDWDDYLNNKLLGLLRLYSRAPYTIRVFHILEFGFDEFNLRYQFGIHNPDYPAPIRNKMFVLDFDAYSEGLQESDEVFPNLDRYHSEIQELFEFSVTDKLRKHMNE